MNSFDFSVLMPVYIKENPAFFALALDSILQQSLLPNEIVIVEDGPLTTHLYQELEKYQKKYPGLIKRVPLRQNMGMGIAMNTGLQACSYPWVARMDSDDIARTERFEKQIAYLKANPSLDAIGSFSEEFNNVPGDLGQIRQLPVAPDDLKSFCKKRNPINHMTVLYRREAAIAAGGYWQKRVFEDYNLWYQMIRKGYKLANIPEILMDVRIGNNMVGRRRGIGYLKEEYHFFNQMKNDGFISPFRFAKTMLIRSALRIMPTKLLHSFYYHFLRSNK